MFLLTDYSYTGTIGGSVAGAVFFVVLCVIFGVVCRRRVYARSITTYGSPNQATTVITQSGSQQMGGKRIFIDFSFLTVYRNWNSFWNFWNILSKTLKEIKELNSCLEYPMNNGERFDCECIIITAWIFNGGLLAAF